MLRSIQKIVLSFLILVLAGVASVGELTFRITNQTPQSVSVKFFSDAGDDWDCISIVMQEAMYNR